MTDLNKVFGGFSLGQIYDLGLIRKLWFGIGAVDKVGELAKGIAVNTNVIIITDSALVKLGIIDSIRKSLEETGFTVDVSESAGAEPVLDEVKKVINMVRSKDYGLVIGVGGGSAMDRAK